MRSTLLVAAAVLGGVLTALGVAYLSLYAAAASTYDTLRPFEPNFFSIFTVLTVPIALLVVWKGTTGRQRGFAAGALIAWTAIGIWVLGGIETT